MPQLPFDTSVEAEYTDGYILSETKQDDVSLYQDGKNTFYDVLEKLPEAEHGRMVRFSVFYKGIRHNVDWTSLPDNARPIRFRDGFIHLNVDGQTESGWSGCRFGYQYTDENGKNVKEIKELT